MTTFVRLVLAMMLAGLAGTALADSWAPPSVEATESADHRHRVVIVPRDIGSALAYFEEKTGAAPASPRRDGPVARIEARDAAGAWQPVRDFALVNDVAPTSVLLANDAQFLVTFDNWHSVGYGDDVVAIYDRHGTLVRKLGLEDILPAAYVNHLPRSVSSRWWGGGHVLVDEERRVELHVVEPGAGMADASASIPVRLRLADGAVIPPEGAAWEQAMARALQLEAARQAAWDRLRQARISPLPAPTTRDTHAWRNYMFEIRDRIAGDDERMGGMVLAAPGEDKGWHSADRIRSTILTYDPDAEYSDKSWIFVSPVSATLADVLSSALRACKRDALKDLHLVFVGTPADGQRLVEAARGTGARITVVDSTIPVPPGKPLPEQAPAGWWDRSAMR
jgi:hypothetical protein